MLKTNPDNIIIIEKKNKLILIMMTDKQSQ